MTIADDSWAVRRYFVDEAGDTTLFDRKGNALIGHGGSSRYFIIGIAEVDDEVGLSKKFATLRAELQANPETKEISSLDPKRGKTAIFFHAKDDHTIVRGRVFEILSKHPIRFFAVIRDKNQVLSDLEATQRLVPSYRYSETVLYDSMVGRLFRDRLHADDCHIVFAKRGRKPRTEALRKAIEEAKEEFRTRWNAEIDRESKVLAGNPKDYAGLQAVDYCLWALQRLITRGDRTAWRQVSSKAIEIVSLEDTLRGDGKIYTPSRPLETW